MNGYDFEIALEGPEVSDEALDRLADAVVDMLEGTGMVLEGMVYGRRGVIRLGAHG